MAMRADSTHLKRAAGTGDKFRALFEVTLEIVAVLDLISDLLVTKQLATSVHIAWATITIFAMFSPYFASQIPYIIFLKENTASEQSTVRSVLLGLSVVTPAMLPLMFVMDLLFLVISVFIGPTVFVLELAMCRCVRLTYLLNAVDRSYEALFRM